MWVMKSIDPSTDQLRPDCVRHLAHLVQNNVGVDYKPMTLLGIKLGMLCEPLVGQYRSKPREIITQMTFLKPTRNIIPDISFSQDCLISFIPIDA